MSSLGFISRRLAVGALVALVACKDSTAPATPSYLAFSTVTATAVAGTPISPAVKVEIHATNQAIVSGASDEVTIFITGTISGTLTRTAVNGVATFDDLVISQPGSYALRAMATGLTGATSSVIVVAPAAR